MARCLVIVGGMLLAVLVLAGASTAQSGGASAEVTPPVSQPGDDLTMIFEIPAPGTAELVVQEELRCTLTFPDNATREPCGQTGDLIEVRTNGSGPTAYRVPYQAPGLAGPYEVVFQAEDTARVPPQTYRAEATFQVTEVPPDPTNETPIPTDDTPDADTGAPGPGEGDDPAPQPGDDGLASLGPRTDEARMIVSTGLGATVATAGLVANRWSLGGG